VHHVVSSIIAPFGEPIEARPPVPSEEERFREREEKLRVKHERRADRDRLAKLGGEELDGEVVDGEEAGEVKGVQG
jgi:small subunit ribosomal protein S17